MISLTFMCVHAGPLFACLYLVVCEYAADHIFSRFVLLSSVTSRCIFELTLTWL
jgi:hypothetical protein